MAAALAVLLAFPACGFWGSSSSRPAVAPRAERVVLLHGLGRSARAMRRLAARFEEAGFATTSIDYESTSQPLDDIVEEVDVALGLCCADVSRLHFVTHSLGGIVLRAWVAREGADRVGRVVMLGPPNQGTEWVDRFGALGFLLGPTGRRLGTGSDSALEELNALGPVPFELGVIAGDSRLNWLGSWILEGPDDGTVSVASTRVDGMRDFLVVPVSHSWMMYDAEVARQAIYFVRTGTFEPASEALRGRAGACPDDSCSVVARAWSAPSLRGPRSGEARRRTGRCVEELGGAGCEAAVKPVAAAEGG